MLLRTVIVVCLLSVLPCGAVLAQSPNITVPLIVEKGSTLQVVLTEKLHYKENEPVRALVAEPVYAFDREVIPQGAEVLGRIKDFKKSSRWKRVLSMVAGDFSPSRDPQIEFKALVLQDGVRIPIETTVQSGAGKLVRFDDGQASEDDIRPKALEITDPEKNRFKDFMWRLSPYRPQSLPTGAHLQITLQSSLDFGFALFDLAALDAIGSQPAAGAIAAARITTALNSKTVREGDEFSAILTRPLFAADGKLIFPEGSRLQGEVMDVRRAKFWHRNGALMLEFKSIELPELMASAATPPIDVEGHLLGVQTSRSMKNVRIDKDGEARIQGSIKRFIAPAYSVFKARTKFNNEADPLDHALLGAERSWVTKRIIGGDSGFGLTGSVAGAMIPTVGIGLGLYGAGRSVYSSFIGRGQEIQLPVNTLIEIRLESPK